MFFILSNYYCNFAAARDIVLLVCKINPLRRRVGQIPGDVEKFSELFCEAKWRRRRPADHFLLPLKVSTGRRFYGSAVETLRWAARRSGV